MCFGVRLLELVTIQTISHCAEAACSQRLWRPWPGLHERDVHAAGDRNFSLCLLSCESHAKGSIIAIAILIEVEQLSAFAGYCRDKSLLGNGRWHLPLSIGPEVFESFYTRSQQHNFFILA